MDHGKGLRSTVLVFLLISELMGALVSAHARERESARKDTLTGIANGRVFAERVSGAR